MMMANSIERYNHQPVLLQETLQFLDPRPGETFLDATVGGGGHSLVIAEHISPGGTLVGLDRDADALAAAQRTLKQFSSQNRILLLHGDFGHLAQILDTTFGAPATFDGILFDLGVSSYQLDAPRGFSFRRDEPLDMRMDRSTGETAAQLLRRVSETELERILKEYGEEPWARLIARAIHAELKKGHPIQTTGQLAALVECTVPRRAWPRSIHVATRTFQALRIAVNDELKQLQTGLAAAIERLNPRGRIVVISFHSLEDRIVKRLFAYKAGKHVGLDAALSVASTSSSRPPVLEILTKKPVRPSDEELRRNPRARSGRLRAARRLPPLP
ncbi:MAG TPA: 16S rRNA (cytosine(1402)-N(4))-methyltransferase RsmH [Chthonomonas sp.]|nr:16S rRNA (cytosine(1402)-N(4))-methyltransferase RsmH [Chthonomonas sp.]HLH81114.1 16S rRNA (cytosine(1402)-N(4))-methyltransferase RsmH [Chthonomonas sp.]